MVVLDNAAINRSREALASYLVAILYYAMLYRLRLQRNMKQYGRPSPLAKAFTLSYVTT